MTEHSDDLLHIASCHACRDRFTADNVVNFDADRPREPERMREFLETARRLDRERAGVQELVTGLLRETPPEAWSTLPDRSELHSSAAVEQLIEEVRNRVERTPADALTLATAATAIAESLPPASYPAVVLAQVRAMAWKERANTLRYLSRFDEAFAAIETAEERLSGFAGASFDRAVVALVKAMILHQAGRKNDANDLLRDARKVFEEHGDSKMLLLTGMIEGGFLYNDAKYREATELFRELLAVARTSHDVEASARLENNLGFCATHFDDFRAANIHFSNGIALFSDMGAKSEAARAERGAGQLLLAKGQTNAGLMYLRNARQAFEDSRMVEEATICGLEIVQVLLDRGDAEDAIELARTLAGQVANAGLSDDVVTALTRLEATVLEDSAAASLHVRNVRAYLESLQDLPHGLPPG